MAIITSANVASAIVKLVAADALPALVGNLVMGNLVNRDYEPVLAQAGDTVNIPIPPVLVANNIAARAAAPLTLATHWALWGRACRARSGIHQRAGRPRDPPGGGGTGASWIPRGPDRKS